MTDEIARRTERNNEKPIYQCGFHVFEIEPGVDKRDRFTVRHSDSRSKVYRSGATPLWCGTRKSSCGGERDSFKLSAQGGSAGFPSGCHLILALFPIGALCKSPTWPSLKLAPSFRGPAALITVRKRSRA